MEKLKIIILVLGVLLAVSLSIVFFIQSSKLALLREYTSEKQRLTQENEKLLSRLNAALAENQSLQDRLELIQADLETTTLAKNQIQEKYDLTNKEREDLLGKIESYAKLEKEQERLRNVNETLKNQIDTLGKHKLTLEDRLNKLKQDNENLRQEIEEARLKAGYTRTGESKLTQRAKSRESIDLPPIVVSGQSYSGITSPFTKQGNILSVNREYNFVVIDLGQDMGVRNGMVFKILRNNKVLGKVKVIRLRQKIAACDIIQFTTPFRTGDIV